MAELKMAAMCELSQLRLSLWYGFECSFCGIWQAICVIMLLDYWIQHVGPFVN